ncbi:MGH1-like glycoside hydrolase domain-containing protein [Microbacterium ulmi]|uniref:Mannosylglycerate hydrolase MGH1-like glycoside hydrolase domain-containing protein n=1 Tax=Microbacterium ulmi TaxID=179095 RepID=A0A7Y2M1D0_9MICO|nr:hypothetical protein [Microbacterium ulmi]NII69054.1 hypothetical protein [Microbacterium ulmi]NNH04634.1 hypothetical protein [Microbacterium ulmi]
MAAIDEALARLRSAEPAYGVAFVAVGGPLERRWRQAADELGACIRPIGGGAPLLNEGGVYDGAWIESTGTINAEVLDRFAPGVTRATHLRFAAEQRADGLMPYKVTPTGPGFSQIQLVTPLARCVWNHYLLTDRADREYLATMYTAMSRMDEWLATHRDTRGTGGVEAFCTFDTGHDASPRFWFAPDRCFRGEASLVDPSHPSLPYVAPDLTANVACQRTYLALIAEELGQDAAPWRAKAQASLAALWEQCWDAQNGTFYDRDRTGEHVRVSSDVLLRVLACEVGDDAFFAEALERHLFHTRRFLSPHGFTSLSMDDPRFDRDFRRNSWGGPVNFLAQLRAPAAFEHHGRGGELAVASQGVLTALALADRFPQTLDPWSGEAGYTSAYSPSILWLLDAVERWFGILPHPDGSLSFTALPPTRLGHGAAAHAVGYRRVVDGATWELVGDDERSVVLRDGVEALALGRGERVMLDRAGAVLSRQTLTSIAPRF